MWNGGSPEKMRMRFMLSKILRIFFRKVVQRVWRIKWSYLYGDLPGGRYRIGKRISDFRGTGDYDTRIYYVEFEITTNKK